MANAWGRMLSDISEYEEVVDAGFDFAQPIGDLIARLDGGSFERMKSGVRSTGVPFTVCSISLPDEVQVTQRGFNLYVWTEYLKEAASRAAALGCEKLVWADGHARVLPEEGSTSSAREQVLQFLNILGSVAAAFDMSVLVEPLGPRRTNFLNTLDEISVFLEQVRRANLGCLVSLRELPFVFPRSSGIDRFGEIIGHVQMDNPGVYENRPISPRQDDGQEYDPFLQYFKAIPYHGTISLPEDANADDLSYCRSLWAG